MITKIKKYLFSREAFVFLLLLLLSTILWFTRALDQQRTTIIKVPISYMGLPTNINLTGKVPQQIAIKVRDEGMTLLQYDRKHIVPLTIDMNRVYFDEGEVIISSDELKNKISRYVFPSTAVLGIRPDSLLIEYTKLASKSVPIKLDTNIILAAQHMYADSIAVKPNKIDIHGSKSALDSIQSVLTERITFENLDKSIKTSVNLLPAPKGVKFEKTSIDVSVPIEMFTEQKIQVPITVINNDKKENIQLFPPTVEVRYNIGLSKYKTIKKNDIQLLFDLKEAKISQTKQHKLKVIIHSNSISNLSISPSQVEFLIVK